LKYSKRDTEKEKKLKGKGMKKRKMRLSLPSLHLFVHKTGTARCIFCHINKDTFEP